MFTRIIISFLITLLTSGVTAHGQVLHTVHAGTSGVRYGTGYTEGSFYEWFVVDGGAISGYSNNEIVIDWGITPGVYEIRVVETNEYGCIGDTINTFVEVIDHFEFDPFPSVVEICEGEIYLFDAGDGFASYLWSDGTITRTFATGQAGRYWVQVVDDNSLIASDTVELIVNPLPVVDLGPDTILFAHESILLDAGDDGVFYSWSTGQISQSITVYGTDTPVDIWAEVTTMAGCSSSDTIFIDFDEGVRLIIPTVFTPNDDGINDIWIITDIEGNDLFYNYPEAVVEVFNRWGEIVFRSQPGYPAPWDGTYRGRPLQMDSYHYVITLNQTGIRDITGNITIVR